MLKRIIAIIDFRYLILVSLTYGLGISISHYLGNTIRWIPFLNGILWLIGIVSSAFYFREYFRRRFIDGVRTKLIIDNDENVPLQEINILKLYFFIGITWLAVSLIPLTNLVIREGINALVLVIMILHMGLTYLITIFPDYLSKSGLLEFINAIMVANLVPAMAYTLQSNELHWLLLPLTFPLMFFFFALFIILNLRECERNEQAFFQSLINYLGIEKIAYLHNLLIVFGYLIMITGFLYQVQWKLIWPQLMTLPIGAIQIWQINQISKGGKNTISPLVINAIATAVLTTYFLLLTLWL